jgi:hypothetical protein
VWRPQPEPFSPARVDRLIAEAAELHAAHEAKLAAIDFLNFHLPPGAPERMRIALTRPPLPPRVLPPDRSQHSAVAAWRDAREALTRDANAALPL